MAYERKSTAALLASLLLMACSIAASITVGACSDTIIECAGCKRNPPVDAGFFDDAGGE